MGLLARLRQALVPFAAWWRPLSRARVSLVDVHSAYPDLYEQFTNAAALTTNLLEGPSGIPSRHLTEAEVDQLGGLIDWLLTDAEMELQIDSTSVPLDPSHEISRARLAMLTERIAILRRLLDSRDDHLRIQPRMLRVWGDHVYRRGRDILRRSDQFIQAASDGTLPAISPREAINGAVRFIPVWFGQLQETPKDVVEFCIREDLAATMTIAVRPIILETFLQPRNLRMAIETDPESEERWLDIEIDIADDHTAERFIAFVEQLHTIAPPEDANKIRLSYSVRS